MEIRTVPKSEIINSPFQRPLSEALVKKLRVSIEKCGFLVPLILVELTEDLRAKLNITDPSQKYLLIDGQHRYHAGVLSGISDFPSVIVDKEVLNFPLHLNTEKADSIKDKAQKIYYLYLNAVNFAPDLSEKEAFSETLSQDSPHILPIAFAYKEQGLKSPSLVENFVKKTTDFLELPLSEAIRVRRKEAGLITELENMVYKVSELYGISDFILRTSMLSIAMKDAYGEERGKRTLITITDPLPEAVSKVISALTNRDWSFLKERPGRQ